jgi:putative intracellular protease/amidase
MAGTSARRSATAIRTVDIDGLDGLYELDVVGTLPRLVAESHAGETIVTSVCTGAILLGAAGLLDGRPAVTNRRAFDDLAGFGAVVRTEAGRET